MGGNISQCTVCNQIGECSQLSLNSKPFRLKINALLSQLKGKPLYWSCYSERGSTEPILYTLSELLPSESHLCELSCDCGAVLTLLVWINASSCSFLAARSDWVCRRASIWISMSSSCSLISSSSFLCPKSP